MTTEETKPERKPRGFGAFDELVRKIVQVPKTEAEKRAAELKDEPKK